MTEFCCPLYKAVIDFGSSLSQLIFDTLCQSSFSKLTSVPAQRRDDLLEHTIQALLSGDCFTTPGRSGRYLHASLVTSVSVGLFLHESSLSFIHAHCLLHIVSWVQDHSGHRSPSRRLSSHNIEQRFDLPIQVKTIALLCSTTGNLLSYLSY